MKSEHPEYPSAMHLEDTFTRTGKDTVSPWAEIEGWQEGFVICLNNSGSGIVLFNDGRSVPWGDYEPDEVATELWGIVAERCAAWRAANSKQRTPGRMACPSCTLQPDESYCLVSNCKRWSG